MVLAYKMLFELLLGMCRTWKNKQCGYFDFYRVVCVVEKAKGQTVL